MRQVSENEVVKRSRRIFIYQQSTAGPDRAPFDISRIAAAVIILHKLYDSRPPLHLSRPVKLRFQPMLLKKILHIGIPNGLENSMFQLGKIMVLSLVAGFVTASIAANAASNTIAVFQNLPGMAINNAILAVTAQCVGAGDYEQVRYYTKKLIVIIYGMMVFSCSAVPDFARVPFVWRSHGDDLADYLVFWHLRCAYLAFAIFCT